MILIWLTTTFAIALCAYYTLAKWKRRKWPPGPLPHPIIGNAVEIVMTDPDRPYVAFQKMSKKYGNVFSCNLGVCPCVVVNGWKDVHDTHLMDEFNGRCDDAWALDRSWGENTLGLFFSSGEAWKDNRRFIVRILRDVGFSKVGRMDILIQQEVKDMVEIMRREAGKNQDGVFHVDAPFSAAFVNTIYGLIAGERFSLDDPKLHRLVKLSHDWFAASNVGGSILGAFPFLKDWIPEISGFGQIHRSNVALLDYFTALVSEFKSRENYKENPTNFIDTFLNRIESGSDGNYYDSELFTERNLICTINDLFTAGADTTSNVGSFAVRTLVQRPDLQDKLQKHVDQVIGGKDIQITLEHRPNLPYVEAFVLETIRKYTTAPVTLRKTIADVRYGKYEIPKGTNVFMNIHSANMDSDVFGDPETFRPERWIDEATGKIIGLEKMSAFAFGKRNCIGDTFAKSTLFLAFSTFAQQFTFEVDPKTGVPDDTNTKTLAISPKPFNVVIKSRP